MSFSAYRMLGHYASDSISHSRQFLRNWFQIFRDHGDTYPTVLSNAFYWVRASQKPWIGLNNLERFTDGLSNDKSLFDFLEQYPSAFEVLWASLAKAQHLAEILIRNPEDFYWLLENSSLGSPLSGAEIRQQFYDTVFGFQSPYRQISFLHRLHRRHFLRVAMRDILDIADFDQTIKDLSSLAEVLVQTVTELVLNSLEEKNKRPDSKYAVLALGKLGGRELNYSSDIDLMFVYEKDGALPDGENYSRVFQRCSEEICRILNEQSEHGVLYRVDTRLRPDGVSGILCQSVSAYLHYYEQRGRLWERQMLIKATPIAGDREFGARVLQQFEPFIYPRRIRYPLKDIVVHRQKSETTTSGGVNVKTDPGGIRDIEFIVQALQLQFGGQERTIRSGNTLSALRKLSAGEKFLSTDEAGALRREYTFLREVEHALQLQENLQIHLLPETEPDRSLITAILGYDDYPALYEAATESMRRVRNRFNQIFDIEKTPAAVDYSLYTREDWQALFEKRGFRDPVKSTSELLSLANGHFPNNHDAQTREAFWRMCPSLLVFMARAPAPAETLTDFERIIRSYQAVQSLYELFASNPPVLQLFLDLISRAPKVVPWIVQQPALVDFLIALPEDRLTEQDLAELYAPIADPGIPEDHWLDKTRDLHHEVVLTILAQWIANDLPLREIYPRFSTANVQLLQRSLDYWMQDLQPRMAVILAGSAAAHTMVFSSDFDVLFLLEATEESVIAEATREIEHYLKRLQTYTGQGRLFSFDVRLRPEGRSSPLVMPVEKYRAYIDSRMSALEFQAMGKSRFLWGRRDLWEAAYQGVEKALRSRITAGAFWQELMKVEDEALGQKKQRTGKNYVYHPGGMFTVRNTLEWTDLLRRYSENSQRVPDTEGLGRVFAWFQKLRWYLALNIEGSTSALPSSRENLAVIARHLRLDGGEQLLEAVDRRLEDGQKRNKAFRDWLLEEF